MKDFFIDISHINRSKKSQELKIKKEYVKMLPELIGNGIIPIVAILAVFGPALIFIIGIIYIIVRISRNRHEERLAMIKSGRDYPLIIKKPNPKRTLLWGIVFSAFGGSVFILGVVDMIRKIALDRARYIQGEDFWGLVPLVIGIGMILYHVYFNGKEENGENGEKEQNKQVTSENQ